MSWSCATPLHATLAGGTPLSRHRVRVLAQVCDTSLGKEHIHTVQELESARRITAVGDRGRNRSALGQSTKRDTCTTYNLCLSSRAIGAGYDPITHEPRLFATCGTLSGGGRVLATDLCKDTTREKLHQWLTMADDNAPSTIEDLEVFVQHNFADSCVPLIFALAQYEMRSPQTYIDKGGERFARVQPSDLVSVDNTQASISTA